MAAKRKKKETNTADLEMQQPSDIVIPGDGPVNSEPEAIIAVDKPIDKKYTDALAFNEEELEIMLQPSSEENAATAVDVYCNGESKWVFVGVITKLKRKFVENLLRSKPIAISTMHDDTERFRSGVVSSINNRIVRNMRSKYPLSVIRDPSPEKGAEWLRRVMYEQ